MKEYGYFNEAKKEYIITTPLTPRPWENRIWNNDLNIQVNNHGTGITYERDHTGRFILYNWSGNRFLYVYDKTSNELWSPSWYPVNCPLDSYECRHGLNYTEISSEKNGINVVWKTTVHETDAAEIWQIEVTNTTDTPREILIVPCYEIDISFKDPYWGTCNLFKGDYSREDHCLYVKNYSPKRDMETYAVAYHSNLEFEKFEMDSKEFKKQFSSYHNPYSVTADKFNNSVTDKASPVLCAAYNMKLVANAKITLNAEFFSAASFKEATIKANEYQGKDLYNEAKATHIKNNEKIIGENRINTPDEILNNYANTWIKHQSHYNADWNRGWQMGFRDAMQDCDSWRRHEPELVKKRILQAASHIYADGHTVRKWAGIDTKLYFDGGVWFVNTIIMYIKETGDFNILNIDAPYLDEGNGTILDHMKRAMNFLNEQRGAGGICRMGYGDWNDALNGIDREGKGESVWTTMAFIWSLKSFTILLKKLEDEAAGFYENTVTELSDLLNSNYFEYDRYIRALTDAGDKVGSRECDEGKIYLNPQSWALISGVADTAKVPKIVQTVQDNLYTPWGPVLLFPAYTKHDDAIGRISSDPRGYAENGANYVHASLFYCYGLTQNGMTDEALKILHRILPCNPENPTENSTIEPFNITNCFEGMESTHPGRAMFAWRTGSAGWFMKVIWDGILGIIPDYEGVRINASIPSDWIGKKVEATRKVRGMNIHFTFVDKAESGKFMVVKNKSLIPYQDIENDAEITVIL